MSKAGDLIKKISETMGPGNAPTGTPAPEPEASGDDAIPEISDIGKTGTDVGKQSGQIWIQERPGSGWEAYDLGDRGQASKMALDLRGKPLSQVRAELQKRMSDNLQQRGGGLGR